MSTARDCLQSGMALHKKDQRNRFVHAYSCLFVFRFVEITVCARRAKELAVLRVWFRLFCSLNLAIWDAQWAHGM